MNLNYNYNNYDLALSFWLMITRESGLVVCEVLGSSFMKINIKMKKKEDGHDSFDLLKFRC